MAPEVIANSAFSTKADMQELGVILYEFISNRFPYESTRNIEKLKLI